MIRLRALEYPDIEYLYYHENQQKLWEFSNLDRPVSREFIRQLIDLMLLPLEESKQLRLMAELKEAEGCWIPIGTVELFDVDVKNRRAEVGIILFEEHFRNQGYGNEMYQQFEDMIKQHLPIDILYSHVLQRNTEVLRFFIGQKFQQVGIFEKWLYTNKGRENVVFFMKIL